MTKLGLRACGHIGQMPYVPARKRHDFRDRDGRRGGGGRRDRVCSVYSAIEIVSESTLLQFPPDLDCMTTSTWVASGEGTLAISSR